MSRTDLDRILNVDPSSLTDDDMEDLYPAMISCNVDEISDIHNLRNLLKLSQEILQYKDNQVESLLLECGELKQTISSLKPEPAKRKKKGDTASIKQATKDLSEQADLSESDDHGDALRGKNKKIKILMTELETLEKDNLILKEQLTTLTQEMQDATQKMNEMTEDLSSAQNKMLEYKEKISHLERENAALVSQIDEIAAQQVDRDRAIDEFGVAIDARINEWKAILDEKDSEIQRLKENLAQSLVQSIASVKEQNKSEIVHLNEEIDRRDKIIDELKAKLSEAANEINDSATVIEKLKTDAQKVGKNDKKKEYKDLLKKLQDANEKISRLEMKLSEAEEDARLRSSELCEVLSTLKKYEEGNQGLSDALVQIKELKSDLKEKNDYIKDLVNVVNKLEMLNSYQEMEIVTLREKLGIPEDESVSIQNALAKRKKEAKKLEDLLRQNKKLVEENLELKSDIRVLKYKLCKSSENLDFSGNTVDGSTDFFHSTKLAESDLKTRHPKLNISELRENMQLVIEENEALRTGMHEILDSIRNQDGKSVVEIQSSTLERLLEALDVRHLAGWYHPAMRLQEHLNVVQGSNAELRGQLKQLRKEVRKKDHILQKLALNKNTNVDSLNFEESDNEKLNVYLSEATKLQEAYKNEAKEWERQRSLLVQQNDDLKVELEKLKLQLEIYNQSSKILEEGDDEIRRAFANKTKEYAEIAGEVLIANKKNSSLEYLLNKQTEKEYQQQKEAIKNESYLRKALADSDRHSKVLEREISTLQSNLSNSVSKTVFNELKEKHEELSIRFRNLVENNLILQNNNEIETLKKEVELLNQEKDELIEHLRKEFLSDDNEDLTQQLKEAKTKELLEKQRADHVNNLHEVLQTQLSKSEENLKELITAKSELQEELIILHERLSKEANPKTRDEPVDDNKLKELEDNVASLKIEKENLTKLLRASQEEAERQYSLNSLNTLELDGLRHQILDLQAISEDKATISRLDFELASKKIAEMELNSQKGRLEEEVSRLQEEFDKSRTTCEGLRSYVQDCRKQCENRCRNQADVIAFLQNQYAGSTSISALDRILLLFTKLSDEKRGIDTELKKAKECQENVKIQQETLTNRLQIVESLKDILEQQIGSNGVQDIMQRFSEYSQYTLNDFKYKRKLTQLEYELQVANKRSSEYESLITNMEYDMIRIQKAWGKGSEQSKIDTRSVGTVTLVENKHASIEAVILMNSIETQTDPYTCCLEKKETIEVEVQATSSLPEKLNLNQKETPERMIEPERKDKIIQTKLESDEKEVPEREKSSEKQEKDTEKMNNEVSSLREQLNQALELASERSTTLVKYELQIAEYQAKVDALGKTIENRDLQLAEKEKLAEEWKPRVQLPTTDCSDKLALKSTINSLQKLLGQKEETIARYQNLLKQDRDEHSRAAARLQEEIRSLHCRVQSMQTEAQKARRGDGSIEPEKLSERFAKTDETAATVDGKNTAMRAEEIARLQENISTLEADLKITRELSDRWHRLAEERLQHMDRMRERLEEQHKNELESYRGEINKWQSEADVLRKQLSENRMVLTKGNISLMKEMQEKDDKIHELSLTCQQLQNEIEMLESATRSQRAQNEVESKINEITQTIGKDQSHQHMNTDAVRKQLQSLLEKEKAYKQEILDLKQQLSRRYMALKSQEKKTSQREVQLERRVKALEEDLDKARAQLDREYLAQEVKKAKTAEELALWEKQKKWQQTAEKLREKLKEKSEEYTKLLSNYEKLRAVVACMEREKWYLKSKLKMENNTVAGGLSARPLTTAQQNVVEELQRECQILRNRVKELIDRLENDDNKKLLLRIDDQKNRINALETVSQGNSYVVNQLEKLEMTKDILEKMNLTLESENFELRLELEKANADSPRLREKIEHLEKYVELLKVEKSSDSTPRSLEKDNQDESKKSVLEMEKTIFTLKRIIEKLQAENRRLKLSSKKTPNGKLSFTQSDGMLQKQHEEAQKRIVALETDLQLAEQRLAALGSAQKEDDNGEIKVLRDQLNHKSELLDKVKHLLSRAAMNEKTLRQRVQQLESRQTLSTIPECIVIPPTPE